MYPRRFAAVALLLASVGLYGVISSLVRQRTREIGIRLAFGAADHSIMRLIVGQGLVLAGLGIALGLVAAFGVTRVMGNLLFGVTATDPITFGVLAVLLVVVTTAACYLPAKRAMDVDPMVALKSD
jgi:putative ABC transport system permease protein